MAYTPINIDAYTNAYSGALAGMAISGWIVDPTSADYSNVATIAGAFAQAFDVVWNNATALNWLQIQSIQSVCQEQFAGHAPGSLDNTALAQVANWAVPAAACAALVLQGDAFVTSEGITPNTPGSGGGIGVLDQVVYVSKAAAAAGDGSIGAPFNTLQDAADALSVLVPTPGGIVLVGPGDYSAESLSYSDNISIAWLSLGPLLQTAQGSFFCPTAPRFPGISLIAGLGGSVQCFQGIVLNAVLDLTGATLASFTGCVGISVTGAQLAMVNGGQVVATNENLATVVLQNVDIFNASLAATNFMYLMGCNSWGQAVSVAFPVGSPPGSFAYYDVTTKGNATNQAPVVSDGVALFLGLPVQSITGATTQDQVDSIVTALVNLGLATDDR